MRITREAFIATILITAVIFLLGYLPFKTELVKPIKQDLFDFDIYDLRFSGKHLHKQTRDTNIVLVEAGAGKKEIAEQLVLLNSLEPAVIGLDVLFESTSDSISDFLIRRA